MARSITLAFVALFLLQPHQTMAQAKPFSHSGIARDAERYEAAVRNSARLGQQKPLELIASGRRALGAGDPRAASRVFAQAAGADPGNAEAWHGLASALLATSPDPTRSSERYDLPVQASSAAYLAYTRGANPAAKARALALLGEALKRRSYWRPAIEALKASLALAESAEVRSSYESLRSEHGFRLIDYSVEQEASEPRICLQFSETLGRGQELAKFLAVDGKDAQGLAAEGAQLCVEGLAHGRAYQILVRAGLAAEIGETLDQSAELAVYVRDRSPSVRFTGRSYVLPSRGQSGIPVVTVNTDTIAIEVYRTGDRNLVATLADGDLQRQLSSYEIERMRDRTGARVYAGEMRVSTRLNEEVTTAVPVGEAVPALQPGVYAMVARPATALQDEGGTLATQWFIVSDLGLTALTGEDGVHALVRSLATAEPVAEASLRLLARNNEVLGIARSDARGYARFEAGLTRGEGGSAPALLVAEGAAGDYAFLDLATAAFDLSDRGVKGREPPGPLDGYLFTERGVYRAGEVVHLTVLVRDRAGAASGVPVTLILTRPDGVEHQRIPLTAGEIGGHTRALQLAASTMTGTWRARVHADPKSDPLASTAFLVEDFVPERLDLTLEPMVAALQPEVTARVSAAGRYLYGPPAANMAIEGDILVRPAESDLEGLAGYRFGLAEEKVSSVRKPLEGLPGTDAAGRAELPVVLPAIPRTGRPLEAAVMVRLREPGGRTIERTLVLPVDVKTPRIGIKPLFPQLQIGEGETAAFDVVRLDAEGRRAGVPGAKWELFRLDRRWQWYSRDGQWTYEPVTLTRKMAGGPLDITAETPARITARVDWGRYRLEVTAPGGAASSVVFSAGWYTEDGADSPEALDIALDRPVYRPGETARLKIAARQGGRALLAVVSDGLKALQEADIPAGGGEVALKVAAEWGPGVYVAAMLYRPMDEKAKRMPARAIGIKWLALDQGARTLGVTLDVPTQVRSGRTLEVPVRVGGLAPGEEARVTLAAVDVGILNLTRYQAPAPERWFYAQRRLGTEIRDFYGRLIDGMRAERGRLRSGGDAADGLSMQGSPPSEATVALFSGIVRPTADGLATIPLDLPEFNGSVRLMAVAWSSTMVGHATADVIVRDPVALTVSGPRFLTLGDEARIEVDLHNVEGPADRYEVSIAEEGPASARSMLLERRIALATSERKAERFPVKPQQVGRFRYDIRVSGPAGLQVSRGFALEVKPPAGDIRRVVTSRLAPGGRLKLGTDLLTDLVPEMTRVSVSVGRAAGLDVPGLLAQLDRYPYGCAEQTTSRALPLLYANELAVQSGLPSAPELRERIETAIARVLEMQDSSGAFGAWGPHGGDMWLSSYVVEFLSRAREQGFAVKPQAFTQALERLQNYVGYARDFQRGGEARAYALYVLARNGRAPIGEVRYYADTRIDRFSTPLAKAQLAAALAMLGDRERAGRIFEQAVTATGGADEAARPDFGSALRDSAAVVTLASETRVARESAARLAARLAASYAARSSTSTQEQAWLLLAARSLSEESARARLSVNGTRQEGELRRMLTATEIGGDGITILNEGDGEVDAVISVNGAALTPEPAVERGFKIERTYYTLDGKPVDVKGRQAGALQIRQAERLVAVLRIEATSPGGRILLVDRLPAGLEIENPRLTASAELKSFGWLKTTVDPEHAEFRDDRFVAAFDLSGREQREGGPQSEDGGSTTAPKGAVSAATVAYLVRAVTPGSFVLPAATVEDMYRPERFARTAAGRFEVLARD